MTLFQLFAKHAEKGAYIKRDQIADVNGKRFIYDIFIDKNYHPIFIHAVR